MFEDNLQTENPAVEETQEPVVETTEAPVEQAQKEPVLEETPVEQPAAETLVAEEVFEAPAEEPVAEASVVDEAPVSQELPTEMPVVEQAAPAEEGKVDLITGTKTPNKKREWFVIQTASGHESKVKGHIEKRIETMEVWDKVFSVVVPERTVTRVKRGKRVEKKEKEYPGYVLVEMILDEDSWRTVREAPGVLGFIGNKKKPAPISEAEVRKILRKSVLHNTPKVGEKVKIDFKIGDTVRIQAGPFEEFTGEVAEINEERMVAKVNVVVFGRLTPAEVPVHHLLHE